MDRGEPLKDTHDLSYIGDEYGFLQVMDVTLGAIAFVALIEVKKFLAVLILRGQVLCLSPPLSRSVSQMSACELFPSISDTLQ